VSPFDTSSNRDQHVRAGLQHYTGRTQHFHTQLFFSQPFHLSNEPPPSAGTTMPVQQTDAPGASAATGAHRDDAGPSASTGAPLLEPLLDSY